MGYHAIGRKNRPGCHGTTVGKTEGTTRTSPFVRFGRTGQRSPVPPLTGATILPEAQPRLPGGLSNIKESVRLFAARAFVCFNPQWQVVTCHRHRCLSVGFRQALTAR